MIYITFTANHAFLQKWWKVSENTNTWKVKWSAAAENSGKIRHSFRNLTKMVEISEKLMYNVFIQEGREDYAAALRTEPAEEPET